MGDVQSERLGFADGGKLCRNILGDDGKVAARIRKFLSCAVDPRADLAPSAVPGKATCDRDLITPFRKITSCPS
jgi:hypothetical protein